jgi:hypothetical protein
MKSLDFRRVSAGVSCLLAFATGVPEARAAGVAVLKEWNFHRDTTAKPVVYLRIIDSHGPYLRLVTRRGNLDIPRFKLANHIEAPDSIPSRIMEEGDAVSLRTQLLAIKRFAARYPLSAGLLEPLSDALAGHLARFDAGQVRFEDNWMTRNELDSFLASRRQDAELVRQREIEHVILSEAQKQRGLVMRNGEWVAESELRKLPPTARTELSDTLWPLCNPDTEGARMALGNLASLADGQTGAAKVRTLRVHAVIRNLFLAEYRLSTQIIASAASMAAAATHERHATQWLKPNAFGTVRADEARESLAKADEIKSRSSRQLDACRAELLNQLREADIVTGDLYQLREHRAALVLAETVRSVASRNFPSGAFKSSIPDDSLSAIRAEMSSRK